MKTLLWLDDIRNPNDQIWIDWLINEGVNVTEFKIVWVKSFTQFTAWITKNGLPQMISFDHDLGETINKKEAPSGFDCAKWLIEHCLDNGLNVPNYRIQSANPVGVQNISGLIENFKKNVKF